MILHAAMCCFFLIFLVFRIAHFFHMENNSIFQLDKLNAGCL